MAPPRAAVVAPAFMPGYAGEDRFNKQARSRVFASGAPLVPRAEARGYYRLRRAARDRACHIYMMLTVHRAVNDGANIATRR